MAKSKTYINSVDSTPQEISQGVLHKMERRSIRAVKTVERRAKRVVQELLERGEEYTTLIDERIDQMKERYWVDRGVDKRVTAAQDSADVIKKDISAAVAKTRTEIDDRVALFKDGVAIMRIELDAEILNVEAACGFADKVSRHAQMTAQRIDDDLSTADARMRRLVDSLEYGY
ncbi:MAG: hypothetical protein LBM63_01665 [Rikenellaceae bacterium]|jgi:hypothetical protein|nr:hypothetical protein [Rikenellaceae bacterium]